LHVFEFKRDHICDRCKQSEIKQMRVKIMVGEGKVEGGGKGYGGAIGSGRMAA
jgi:hypothetical protein